MAILSSLWLKLALLAAIIAAIGVFLWRVYAAGKSAAEVETLRKNLQHITTTAKEIGRADKNLTTSGSPRAKRVRDLFTRSPGP